MSDLTLSRQSKGIRSQLGVCSWRVRLAVRSLLNASLIWCAIYSGFVAVAIAAISAYEVSTYLSVVVGGAAFAGIFLVLVLASVKYKLEVFLKEGLREQRMGQAMPLLNSEVKPGVPLPPFGDGALDPRILVMMVRVLRVQRPDYIVEFGSGVSTLVLGQVAQEIGAKLHSFEHDHSWFRSVSNWLRQRGLDESVALHYAPLVTQDSTAWYDRKIVDETLPVGVGFVVVDGPPRRVGRKARAPALFAIEGRLANEATIALDDCERPDEQAILDEWCKKYPEFQLELVSVEHMMAFLTNHPKGFSWT